MSPETSVKILNLIANISSLSGGSLDVFGDIAFNGDVGVSGDMVMHRDATIKVKNIAPVDDGTSVQVGGGLYIDVAKTCFGR